MDTLSIGPLRPENQSFQANPPKNIEVARSEALERCNREIAQAEAQLRAGHEDMEGLLLKLMDWSNEKRAWESEEQGV